MKHTFSTKFIATLLAVVMLATFVPAFFSFAVEEPDFETLLTTENEDGTIDALSAENGNLAKNATLSFQHAPHADGNWGWDANLLTDGTLNRRNNDTINGGYHSNTGITGGNHSEWIQLAFDEPKAFDTFVVWPCRDEGGICYGMPNGFSIEVSGNGLVWDKVYEVYDYAIPAFGPQIIQFEEVTAKYVRFTGFSINKNVSINTYGMKLCELAVFDTDYTPSTEPYCPNLAVNKPETSINHLPNPDWVSYKINDGSRYNMYVNDARAYGQFAGWHSAGGGNSAVIIDLEEVQEINRYVIWPSTEKYITGAQNADGTYNYGMYLPTSFTISVSTDGVDYTPVYTKENFSLAIYEPIVCDFTKTSAQYVKFDMYSSNYIKLSEVEIYNTDLLVTPEVKEDEPKQTITAVGNHALGATAIYSSIHYDPNAGWDFLNLQNGIIDGAGFSTQPGDQHWVGYTFDNPTTVNKVVLVSAGSTDGRDAEWSGIPHSFTIQYTTDNMVWHEIVTYTNETTPAGQEPVTVEFDPVVASKIIINSNDLYQKPSDLNTKRIQLAEFEVWYDGVDFTEGTIAETEAGKYTIASDNFSAFVSTKASETVAHNDVRVILAADLETLAANLDAELTVSFLDADGKVVKTLTKGVIDELLVYASATAAGNTYTAADGDVLFGIVITGVPNDAWASVEVTLASSEATFAGAVDAEDVIAPNA